MAQRGERVTDVRHFLDQLTGQDSTFQMWAAYSRMVRPLENLPEQATSTTAGLVNDDQVTASYVSAGVPPGAEVGSYAITASLSGAALSNYDLTSMLSSRLRLDSVS